MLDVVMIVIAVLALICIWIMIYDSNRFVVREYQIEDSRIRKPCRAVVLADLHNKKYGKDNEQLLAAIQNLKPDFILIAGDLLTAKPGATLDVAVELLEQLCKEYPVYYGYGNHEHRLQLYPEVYGDMGERYTEELGKRSVRMLSNEQIFLPEYGIAICGSKIDRKYYKRFSKTEMDKDYLESILGKADEKLFQILLAHNPLYFPEYAAWGADLTISGHLHGGMVRIPFVGKGVVSPNFSVFPQYSGGQYEQGKHRMIVSRGLGMHTIPIRLFNPGELLVVDFKNFS